ncbi:hypothetical protein [Aureimonas glaciei]|uniref:Curlin n=1 Tax=Aureimonas glaciei TaxID=1776957 RepID=A0A917D7X0_9HYPH|nr:hypothetical protein [Aureimonas glaciei]GGD04885.1 hypothetical protein GCM10011335_04660 [Aureimonas glaciei]
MTMLVRIATVAAFSLGALPTKADDSFTSLAYLPQISQSAYSQLGSFPTTKDIFGPIAAQIAAIPSPAAGANNLAYTLQDGEGNAASVQQYGQYNVGVIQQTGAYNIAAISQLGNDHSAFIMQSGRGNQAFIAQR